MLAAVASMAAALRPCSAAQRALHLLPAGRSRPLDFKLHVELEPDKGFTSARARCIEVMTWLC
jgi:hypothetical protein